MQKSLKNRSKNEVNMGRYLGFVFLAILVDWGSQVGRENRSKIGPKTFRKIKHFLKASWKPLGSSWTRLGAFGAPLPRPARVRRGCDAGATRVRRKGGAGADGVPMPPGAATIKEYQYTRHQYWITRHAAGQRPGELLYFFFYVSRPREPPKSHAPAPGSHFYMQTSVDLSI